MWSLALHGSRTSTFLNKPERMKRIWGKFWSFVEFQQNAEAIQTAQLWSLFIKSDYEFSALDTYHASKMLLESSHHQQKSAAAAALLQSRRNHHIKRLLRSEAKL